MLYPLGAPPSPPVIDVNRLKIDSQIAADIADIRKDMAYLKWWLGVSISFSIVLFVISILLSAIIALVT